MSKSLQDVQFILMMSPDIIDENVIVIGLQLYEKIIPPNLKSIYWRIRPNIKSIQVLSQERWIPWEIIKPFRKNEQNGVVEEDEFLCERYAFCGWEIGITPRIKEQLSKVKLIVPTDTKLKSVLEDKYGNPFCLSFYVGSCKK